MKTKVKVYFIQRTPSKYYIEAGDLTKFIYSLAKQYNIQICQSHIANNAKCDFTIKGPRKKLDLFIDRFLHIQTLKLSQVSITYNY